MEESGTLKFQQLAKSDQISGNLKQFTKAKIPVSHFLFYYKLFFSYTSIPHSPPSS